MMRTLMVGSLGLAIAAFVLPVQHLFASRSIGETAVANAWKGDVPDLVVVAERASPVTTVYTQSRDGQWGDIPDLVVTAQASAAQPHRELAAARSATPGRHRL